MPAAAGAHAVAGVASSASVEAAVQEKHSPQLLAQSPSIEASAAVAREAAAAEVAQLADAVAAASVNDAAAATAAPAASSPAPAVAAGAVVPVVPSSLDEPVKGENGELLNGGFKRGGAENDPVSGVYDEVELEDFEYDEEKDEYSYPCPCGDRFRISKEDMLDGEDIARCASCSLLLRVIYDPEDLEDD